MEPIIQATAAPTITRKSRREVDMADKARHTLCVVNPSAAIKAPAMAEAAHTLAANLRRLRQEAGLSQEALAYAADLHPDAVGLLERGLRDPQLSTLLALVGALDRATEGSVTIADLTAGLR